MLGNQQGRQSVSHGSFIDFDFRMIKAMHSGLQLSGSMHLSFPCFYTDVDSQGSIS